jgi:VWFA-related protein
MRGQLPLIQKAALDVISQMGSADEAFVMAFTSGSAVLQDFTNNQRALANAVGQIYTSGGTSLLDAVVAASSYVHERGKNRRKALLFITDGVEKGSVVNEDKALTALIENQAQAYFLCLPVQVTVPLLGVKTELKPKRLLDGLAKATGGQSFYIGATEQSSPTADRLVGGLRHQYEVTYASTNNKHADKMRNVRVVVSPKDGRKLKVITRQGYYGPNHKRVSGQGLDKEKG